MSKANFLLSKVNKQNFLLMLVDKLTKAGIMESHACGDDDFLIVQTTLKAALVRILISLFFHCTTLQIKNSLVHKETKPEPTISRSLEHRSCNANFGWNMPWHPRDSCFSGCDTTSRIHSVGKSMFYKSIKKLINFRNWQPFFGFFCEQGPYNRCRQKT